MIGPAAVLAVIVGLFHVSAYVFIRGRAGASLPLLAVASILGAWAGDAVGVRLSIDPVRVGEFHIVSASIVAWLGIGLVAVLTMLVPERGARVAITQPAVTTRATSRTADRSTAGPAPEPGAPAPR